MFVGSVCVCRECVCSAYTSVCMCVCVGGLLSLSLI